MIFIVDTNIIFAALLKDSTTRKLLIDSPFILFSPETSIKEIRKYEDLILQKSGLKKEELEILFNIITDNITIIEKERYTDKMSEAEKIIGHIDKGDIPFVALALSIANDGIWTGNIQHFGKQNKIKIWITEDILKII